MWPKFYRLKTIKVFLKAILFPWWPKFHVLPLWVWTLSTPLEQGGCLCGLTMFSLFTILSSSRPVVGSWGPEFFALQNQTGKKNQLPVSPPWKLKANCCPLSPYIWTQEGKWDWACNAGVCTSKSDSRVFLPSPEGNRKMKTVERASTSWSERPGLTDSTTSNSNLRQISLSVNWS
jgi:hypothetical protein